MGCHLLCNDGLGRCMSIFVYIIMLLGMLVVVLTILIPALGTEDEARAWIEYFCYSFFWSMMVTSHMRTMCADPGFIPEGYNEYKEEVLVAPFKSFVEYDKAYDMIKAGRSGSVKRNGDRSSTRLASVNDSEQNEKVNEQDY